MSDTPVDVAAVVSPACTQDRRNESYQRCGASIAVLVVGPFREFAPHTPGKHPIASTLNTDFVWRSLIRSIVLPNGPADVLVSTWDSPLARRLLLNGSRIVSMCASVCEPYDDEYRARLAATGGFKLIAGNLRFRDRHETPHTVDFFYKRYQALQLVEHVERFRGRRYAALIMTRPDLVFVQRNISAGHIGDPYHLRPRTVYVHNTDHHHDSTDTSTEADPFDRGLCGQIPNDWFAYGDRDSMGAYLSALPSLPSLYARLRQVKGACDWWKCHNYRYNFSVLINSEALLGMHLRTAGLGCRDVRKPWRQPPIGLSLPLTRKKDWR